LQDTSRLADLGSTRGGIMVSVILSVLFFFYLVGLYFVWRVRARSPSNEGVARMQTPNPQTGHGCIVAAHPVRQA